MSGRDAAGACVVWLMLIGTELMAGPQLRSSTPPVPEADAALRTSATPWAPVFMAPETNSELEARVAQALQDAMARRDARPPCVMPVVEADPAVDPDMAVPVPDSGVRFTMRTIEPPCAPVRP